MRGRRACSLVDPRREAARSIEAVRADLELRAAHARDVISGAQRGNGGAHGQRSP